MASKRYNNEKVFTLRIDQNVFEKVKVIAQESKRSIAKQIEFMLERAIENHKSSS